MRALTVAGVFGLLVGSGAIAEEAPVHVQTFPAPDAAGAVQMGRLGNGEIWFAQPSGNSLARVNADGSLSVRFVPVTGSEPLALSREEFSTLVFTEVGTNRIGVLPPNGSVTEYDIPTAASNPRGVAGTSAGTIWFTEYDGNRIGRLQSGAITEFPVPTFSSGPLGIATGPGGTWFTENLANKIGLIDDGGAITEFFIPTPDSGPTSIIRGGIGFEGFMYFTETRGNKIGRISPTGQVNERPIPTPNAAPADLVWDDFSAGVWFTEHEAGQIGWMSVEGRFREFRLPGGSRPESLALDYGSGFFGPASVWYVDGTRRRVGRLSDNHLFGVGVGNSERLDTEIEITNVTDESVKVRLGWPGVCPAICPETSADLVLPRNDTVEIAASAFPFTQSRFLVVSGIEPEISDVPETDAWVIDSARPDVRIRLPLVSYWEVASVQPPFRQGNPKPTLEFPARRRNHVRTSLILAGIESEEPGQAIALQIDAVGSGGNVVAREEVEVFPGSILELSRILSDLGIFGDFDGHLRVTRLSRAGYFWGVVEIYESDVLTRLMPPGSELEPPAECTGGPARCHPRPPPRVVTREP